MKKASSVAGSTENKSVILDANDILSNKKARALKKLGSIVIAGKQFS